MTSLGASSTFARAEFIDALGAELCEPAGRRHVAARRRRPRQRAHAQRGHAFAVRTYATMRRPIGPQSVA